MMIFPFLSTQAWASNSFVDPISIPISKVTEGTFLIKNFAASARGRQTTSIGNKFAAVFTAQTISSISLSEISDTVREFESQWNILRKLENDNKFSAPFIQSNEKTALRK